MFPAPEFTSPSPYKKRREKERNIGNFENTMKEYILKKIGIEFLNNFFI